MAAYSRTGFTGPLSWCRNLHRNGLDTAKVMIPALMVCAANDYFLPPETTAGWNAMSWIWNAP